MNIQLEEANETEEHRKRLRDPERHIAAYEAEKKSENSSENK